MSYLLAVNEYCLLSAAFGGAYGYQKGRRTNRKNILNRVGCGISPEFFDLSKERPGLRDRAKALIFHDRLHPALANIP